MDKCINKQQLKVPFGYQREVREMARNRKGQSTLEYVALFAAVVVAVVVFVGSKMKTGVTEVLDKSSAQMKTSADGFSIPAPK